MTISTYGEKRDLVQAYRRVSDWFFSFCNCGGSRPTIEDYKTGEHHETCPYRLRVESQNSGGK